MGSTLLTAAFLTLWIVSAAIATLCSAGSSASYDEDVRWLNNTCDSLQYDTSDNDQYTHRPRLLHSVDGPQLEAFRAVDKKGLLGFHHVGGVSPSTALECAKHCTTDPLCLSFDLEQSTSTCYVSHTDRYAHPEAFLDFPTGVYYEWQGAVDETEFAPNGGRYSTQIVVRVFTKTLGAVIHYQIKASSTDTEAVATSDLVGSNASYRVAQSGDSILLPPFSCRLYALAVKDGREDSGLVVSQEYKIYPSKYLFLVPSFNGKFHGRVVRIQLDVRGKKRPRPARFHEFSDYETTLGMGPYATQLSVIDMATLNLNYVGFSGGFTALGDAVYVNESYLIPAADDPNFTTVTWRTVLEAYYIPHPRQTGIPTKFTQATEFLYLTPYFNGVSYRGEVIRVLSLTFNSSKPVIDQLNLTEIDPDLKGFAYSFVDDDDKYAYFVPQENENGLTGKFVRLALAAFDSSGVSVLDLAAINPLYVGFSHAFKYNQHAYLISLHRTRAGDEATSNLREFPVPTSGLVVRIDLLTFQVLGSLDLAKIHPQLVGFSAAIPVANFAYFVPYMRVEMPASVELNPYSGVIARLDLRDFSSVEYMDISQLDKDLRGFMRGFAFRQYIFLVPHRSRYYAPGDTVESGKVVRIDTNDFTLSGVQYLDLAASVRSQVPNLPDNALRGFRDGVVSGKYGFFVPYFNGATFSGKVCRINLDKFDEVQTLDLSQYDDRLRGFSGGIVSVVQEELEIDLFGDFEVRSGTTSPYAYVY